MNRNLILLASVIAGASYWLVMGQHPQTPWLLAWKAAGVALLALWAWSDGGKAARVIAVVMALGATADVAIASSFSAGGAVFFAGHMLAVWLYRRNARAITTGSQRAAALALLVLVPLLAWRLAGQGAITLYAAGLGAMAASAWVSRFSRYRVGLGALAFVASDLLIFARMGPLAHSALPGLLVMPLYYLGQLAICTGVVRAGGQPGSSTAPEGAR